MKLYVPEHILSIDPYVPGKPMEELEREYGISDSVKLASNENPLGPSPRAVEAIRQATEKLNRYPDGAGYALVQGLAAHLDVTADRIVLGNGSDEIIGLLARALLNPGDEAILPDPSFLMYAISVRSTGAVPRFVPLRDMRIDLEAVLEAVSPATRMVFLCNPNNPTGTVFSGPDLARFLTKVPENVLVVLDEAYIEFVRDPECARSLDFMESGRSVVGLRTFSKAYGLAGLRIGYGVMPGPLAQLLHRIRPPFNASIPAQAGALAALDDVPFLEETIRTIHGGLDFLYGALDRLGLRYFPTQANFFMIDMGRSADLVFEQMLRQGVIVRSMTSYGYPEYIRINVGLASENERFIDALKTIL